MKKTYLVLALICIVVLAVITAYFWSSVQPSVAHKPFRDSLALDNARAFLLPLNNPDVIPANKAIHMKGGDLVIGLVVNGQPRAYPLWIMVSYHVVNDTVNGFPLLVSYCELCSSSSAFKPVVDEFPNRSLAFQVYSIELGTFSIYDYQTQSVWSPFSGRTFSGRLHPNKMKRIPIVIKTWDKWKQDHPDTVVINTSQELLKRRHGRGNRFQPGASFLPPLFARTVLEDARLATNTLVYGIYDESKGLAAAFPLNLLDNTHKSNQYELGSNTYLIFKPGSLSIYAFQLSNEQRGRDFRILSDKPLRIVDNHGNSWNEFGESLQPGKKDLIPANGRIAEWYEWASAYPKTEIIQ